MFGSIRAVRIAGGASLPHAAHRMSLAAGAVLLIAAGIVVPSALANAVTATAPTPGDLADASPLQPRWISRPNSRIVVNPYDVNQSTSPVQQSNRADLPLNAAYYVGNTAPKLDDTLMLQQQPDGPAPGAAPIDVAFDDPFTAPTPWSPTGQSTVAFGSRGRMTLTNTDTTADSIGSATRSVTVDVDEAPSLRLSVTAASASWALSVVDESGATHDLQTATSTPGVFFFDLRSAGLSGTQTLTLKIDAVGPQSSLQLDDLQISSRSAVPVAFSDSFDSADPGWTPSSKYLQTTTADGALTLNVPTTSPAYYGWDTRPVVANLDTYPILKIKVDAAARFWAIKVNNGSSQTDTLVQNNTTQLGTFSYDLSAITGWKGTQNLQIKLFVNGYSAPATFDSISLQGRTTPWLESSSGEKTTWMPDQLPFSGSYPEGLKVRGVDTFHDVDSLSRTVVATGMGGGRRLMLAGQYFGTPTYDPTQHVLTFTSPAFSYAVALPDSSSAVSYFADRDALELGGPRLTSPSHGRSGYWSVLLGAGDRTNLKATVGVGFAVAADPSDAAATRAIAARSANQATDIAHNDTLYQAILNRAPRPSNFAIQATDSGTATPADVRRMYYRAWVFLASDVLPPQPENGYPYPQLAVGKPSLYLHGSPQAPATASWDSSIGMQFLAYIEPDLAWQSFTGLMSLVPASGHMPGEFLPSREAQTAWVLYSLTGDSQRLSAIYPALSRDLSFKQEHPLYNTPGDDVSPQKDLPFIASALVDTRYAEKIANHLGLSDDVAAWKMSYSDLENEMVTWFWASPNSQPPQVINISTGVQTPGNVMSITPALDVPELRATNASGLLAEFHSLYDPTKPFAGFGNNTNDVRYGITSQTIDGLIARGDAHEAMVLSNSILRDIVGTHMFSERYQWDDSGIFPAGERPSIFGAATVIDAVWMNNGYRMDSGTPAATSLTATSGSVEGITIQDHTLTIEVDPTAGLVRWLGTAVRPERRTAKIAYGQTIELSNACSTIDLN